MFKNEKIAVIDLRDRSIKLVDDKGSIVSLLFIRDNKLKPDYLHYITNQIMKPVSQLFELVIEKLPNFPYGIGYYDEMYNIWYNKYSDKYKNEPEKIELKTEKKIKELKATS